MSRRGALARLATAYATHQLRRRLPGTREGGGEERFLNSYRPEHLVPLSGEERERLPAMSACINCGLCALAAGRLGAVRLPDLASAYLRPYPLLGSAESDLRGSEPDWRAAAAACPVGVPLEEVAAMVRRLSGL